MRKVDIRQRTRELDAQVLNKKATPAQQRAERERLMAACAQAGDHVYEQFYSGAFGSGIQNRCAFCGRDEKADVQRTRRALTTCF